MAVTGLGFIPTAAQAATDGSGLVISEVYGGGGSTSGSPFSAADFVELYNPTDAAVPLSGLSLQYPAAGYTGPRNVSGLTLPGKAVPAHDHFLVQVSSGSNGPALPTPDHTGTALSMSGTAGQVLLVDGTSPFTTTGDLAGKTGLVDMVGYGTTATSFEHAHTSAS